MHEHQVKGYQYGNEAEDGRKEEAKPVEGDAVPERGLVNCLAVSQLQVPHLSGDLRTGLIFGCLIANRPAHVL